MTFGDRLRELRRNKGKSQLEVVEEIGSMFGASARISQTTLSTLEQRETAPREDILDILAKYYGVPISYFFEDRKQKQEKISRARTYLETLRAANFETDLRFAHSTELRNPNDDTEHKLGRININRGTEIESDS